MIANNRTLTAVTFFGAVLAVSLVSQPGHAGVALNGANLNGTNLNGVGPQGMSFNGMGAQGVSLNGVSPNSQGAQGVSPNGTTPQAAGFDTGWGSIEGRLLSIGLPPVTAVGSR
jgi:uncharacterized protein YjbI with pentapeptide repeats